MCVVGLVERWKNVALVSGEQLKSGRETRGLRAGHESSIAVARGRNSVMRRVFARSPDFTMKKLLCLLGIAGLGLSVLVIGRISKATLPEASLAQVKWGEPVNDVAFDPNRLAGKVVVVEEWGVNCAPCLASLPGLAEMARSGAGKGLIVVGLERQQSSMDAILKVVRDAGIGYPVRLGGSAPGSTGEIPYVCVFDRTGRLVFHGNPHHGDFGKAVKKALRELVDKA
jgi:hypothetical protein